MKHIPERGLGAPVTRTKTALKDFNKAVEKGRESEVNWIGPGPVKEHNYQGSLNEHNDKTRKK